MHAPNQQNFGRFLWKSVAKTFVLCPFIFVRSLLFTFCSFLQLDERLSVQATHGRVLHRLTPGPGKLLAIQKWKHPETILALRGFLGCCNFYHTFVEDYVKYAAPLTDVLKVGKEAGRAGQKVRVQWTDECHEAIVQFKAAICKVATLHVPKFDRPFHIELTLVSMRRGQC